MRTTPADPAADGTHLERPLTLLPLVLFGIAYVTPFIVLTTFGVFSQASHGTLATAYALATIAMLFTAMSYAKMASLHPSSGSAYAYARQAFGGRIGFLVGWSVLLDYFFLPMVVWLFGTAYLTNQFPTVPAWVFLLVFILATTTLNVIGITVATRVSLALVAFQILVLIFFVAFSLRHVLGSGGGLTLEPFWNPASTVGAVSAGAALTAYSFIGFDAVSTFAEETRNPTRTVPRAIILTALVAGGIFVLVAYVVQLAHPGGAFANADSAALDLARRLAGDVFAAVFLSTVIVAQFTAGVPIQAAGARLMYAMGRDGVLPRPLFGRLHPRFHTPVFNLCLTGAVGLVALGLSVTTSTSFINFGAFTAFALVNLSVVAHYVQGRREGVHRSVLGWVVFPLVGLTVVLWLMSSLDPRALTLGGVWLVLGFGWLLVLTGGLRRPPPELTFEQP